MADAHTPEARARFYRMTAAQRMSTTLNRNYLVEAKTSFRKRLDRGWPTPVADRRSPCPRCRHRHSQTRCFRCSASRISRSWPSSAKSNRSETNGASRLGSQRCNHLPPRRAPAHSTLQSPTGTKGIARLQYIQPYHSGHGDVQTTLHLDHPLNINPKWKLRAGPWLVGSIICDQWSPDTSGGEHPPYRGKVLAWDASQDKKAKFEYFDFTHNITMQDLDDSTTHSYSQYAGDCFRRRITWNLSRITGSSSRTWTKCALCSTRNNEHPLTSARLRRALARVQAAGSASFTGTESFPPLSAWKTRC